MFYMLSSQICLLENCLNRRLVAEQRVQQKSVAIKFQFIATGAFVCGPLPGGLQAPNKS
jgi:hypothetical protein